MFGVLSWRQNPALPFWGRFIKMRRKPWMRGKTMCLKLPTETSHEQGLRENYVIICKSKIYTLYTFYAWTCAHVYVDRSFLLYVIMDLYMCACACEHVVKVKMIICFITSRCHYCLHHVWHIFIWLVTITIAATSADWSFMTARYRFSATTWQCGGDPMVAYGSSYMCLSQQ